MERRTILRRAGAAAAIGLAGCLGSGPDDTGNPNNNESQNPGDGSDPTGTPTPPVVAKSIETLGTDCGSPSDSSSSVLIDPETSTVTVSGTFVAPTPCHEVVFDDVTYDEQADTLSVTLEDADTDADGCEQCIGALEYSATIEFESDVPERVVVEHGDEIVASTGSNGESTEPTSIADSHLTVTDVIQSDEPTNSADVDFHPEDDTVVVTGSIEGHDGCQTATMAPPSYNPDTDTLSVDIRTTAKEGSGDRMCTQALITIDYKVTFTFAGGLPGSVELSHDGSGIAGAGYDEATDGSPTRSTETRTTEIVETDFEVLERRQAGGGEQVDIEFDQDESIVRATGSIQGSDGCKTAVLDDVRYDEGDNMVSIHIATTDREGTEDQACTDAIVSIEYEAIVEFEGSLPKKGAVSHNGVGIAAGAWASGGASAESPSS